MTNQSITGRKGLGCSPELPGVAQVDAPSEPPFSAGRAIGSPWLGDGTTYNIIARKVRRYSCPFCNRSRSHRATVENHAARCWKNPLARSCGTCANYLAPERGENADYITGYPGSPPLPRGCDAGVDIELALPRECERWTALSTEEQRQHSASSAEIGNSGITS